MALCKHRTMSYGWRTQRCFLFTDNVMPTTGLLGHMGPESLTALSRIMWRLAWESSPRNRQQMLSIMLEPYTYCNPRLESARCPWKPSSRLDAQRLAAKLARSRFQVPKVTHITRFPSSRV
jgi:hypothetical protein